MASGQDNSTTPKEGENSLTDGQLNAAANFFKIAGWVLNKVGLIGFIVTAITTFVFAFASEKQKEAIIDTWILFNRPTGNIYGFNFHATIVIALLSATIILQRRHYKSIIISQGQRIELLANEKSKKQSKAIGRKLSSSTTTTKPT